MKTRMQLATIAMALFAISFLLPAFDDLFGYQCFLACWALFVGKQSESFSTVVYYGAFVPTNAVFVISAIHLFRTSRTPGWVKFALVAATVHVLSWGALNAYGVMSGSKLSLGIGYLLWLAAYTVCAGALAIRKRAEPGATDNLG
jgi:hypothetical protein